jgi:hypothetical protein
VGRDDGRNVKTPAYVGVSEWSYLVAGKVPDEDGFWAFVAYIAEHGFEAQWREYRNTYLELGGWRYWAMPGRGDSSFTIVNRERLPGQPLRRID